MQDRSWPLMARRQFLGSAGLLLLPTALTRASWVATPVSDSVVLAWNAAFLQGVRESKLGPPMAARALAVAHTCIYDAWAAYDDDAIGTVLGGALRRPVADRTVANITRAIAYAAYRAAIDLFPGSAASAFHPLMQRLHLDAGDRSTDTSTATGIGNVAARAALDARHRDGANQLGDAPGGAPGVPYSDYTGYVPANAPMDLRAPFDPGTVRDPDRWQPLRYVDASGTLVTQGFVGAQWQRVTPFAMRPGALRSPTGPPRHGSAAYRAQAQAVLDLSACLTDRHKMIAEYWADGPRSELPPGHWNLFAQYISRRDRDGAHRHAVKRDVKLLFALNRALGDAACCAWTNKCAFDSVRPVTAIRHLFQGQTVRAWAGPFQGAKSIDGAAWTPYQPSTFPTPPFPEYSSGHSTFSAAAAEILRRFTGGDRFGGAVTLRAGSSTVEPGAVPACDLTLRWATFSDAADEAGMSRRYGGIHFEQGDLDGRAAGRIAGRVAWRNAQEYWKGG